MPLLSISDSDKKCLHNGKISIIYTGTPAR